MPVPHADGWIDSPFRTKGVLYLGTQSYFREQATQGIEGVAAELPEGRLRAFIGQKFLAGSQYEVMVVPALIAAEARSRGASVERYLAQRTRWQAEQDIGGVYRLLLKLTSPETVVTRLPRVVTQMFNFGKPVVTVLGPGHATLECTGIPATLVSWLQVGFAVYIETAVRHAGARRCSVRTLEPRPEPSQGGFPMATLRGDVTWE